MLPDMGGAVSILAPLDVSLWLTGRFTDPSLRLHLTDQPNHLSLHQHLTIRSGRITILASLAVTPFTGVKKAHGPDYAGGALLFRDEGDRAQPIAGRSGP